MFNLEGLLLLAGTPQGCSSCGHTPWSTLLLPSCSLCVKDPERRVSGQDPQGCTSLRVQGPMHATIASHALSTSSFPAMVRYAELPAVFSVRP